MNDTKTWIWVVVAIVVIGGAWLLHSKHSTSADNGTGPYKIGVILPLTGDAASYGEPALNVYKIAVKEINDAGGVNGRQLSLIVEDGKCTGQDAANATQKLVNVDKVQVILGGFCSSESLAAVPVAAQGKVALISGGSSSPKLTGVSPYFARNYPSDATQGTVLADIAYNDKGWHKIAFIQEQTDYAQGIYQAFTDEFKKLGGAVTNDQFPTGTNDFRSVITKIKAAQPDAVFVDTQTAAAAARVFTQIEQAGWMPKTLLADIIISDPDTLAAHKALLEGGLGAEVGTGTNSKISGLVASYKSQFNKDLPYQSYGQTEYDAVYLIKDAIAAAGYNGTAIAKWFHTSVKDWQGAAGSVTIGSNGDPLAGHKPEVITNGKVQPYAK